MEIPLQPIDIECLKTLYLASVKLGSKKQDEKRRQSRFIFAYQEAA
jgi:hypothetical protein